MSLTDLNKQTLGVFTSKTSSERYQRPYKAITPYQEQRLGGGGGATVLDRANAQRPNTN